jgi:hypothetical protein
MIYLEAWKQYSNFYDDKNSKRIEQVHIYRPYLFDLFTLLCLFPLSRILYTFKQVLLSRIIKKVLLLHNNHYCIFLKRLDQMFHLLTVLWSCICGLFFNPKKTWNVGFFFSLPLIQIDSHFHLRNTKIYRMTFGNWNWNSTKKSCLSIFFVYDFWIFFFYYFCSSIWSGNERICYYTWR